MILRLLVNLVIGLSLASCAGLTGVGGGDNEATQTVSQAAGVLTDADQCRIALLAQPTAATRSLDQTRMRLLNWNTQKNTDTNMQADLTRLAERQQVSIPIALRVIDFRLDSVFREALAAQ